MKADRNSQAQTDDPEKRETTELDALKLLLNQFHELREYFSCFVTAKADAVKLSLRNSLLWMVLASLVFIAVGGLMVAASWFVLSGTAEGLGVLCGGRLWVGKILAGFLVLAGLGLGVYYTVVKRKDHADRAVDAKNAMSRTLHDMKNPLNDIFDVRSSVRRHPWVATGSAAAAGFVTGAVLTPTNSEAERQPSCQEQEAPRTKKSFLFATAGTILASILQTVVQNSIASAVAAKEQSRVETPPPNDSTGAIAPETGTD